VVVEVLPNALFSIRLDDGRKIKATLAPAARHGIVRLISGARVMVEVSSRDGNRGRIVRCLP
jgi:translation initiation factor IF-1